MTVRVGQAFLPAIRRIITSRDATRGASSTLNTEARALRSGAAIVWVSGMSLRNSLSVT